MSRIAECFQSLRQTGRKALIPYITAGDPSADATVSMLHGLVAAGADIIELGVPFSDPMADGPVIQKAYERALAGGMSLHQVLDLVERFRHTDATTPVVLMGYLNPIEAMGYTRFAHQAGQAGVDGVLTVDLPPEEALELTTVLATAAIDPIFLLAPTSTPARIRRVAEMARGYVYYVSLKGITGSSAINVSDVADKVVTIKKYIDLPIGVGFGIKNAETAMAVSQVADAVVVGSAIVSLMGELATDPAQMKQKVINLVSTMRRAMDTAAAQAGQVCHGNS
jgi:tryptophan synthase alpha chain